jgi:hypothetical protein
MGGNPFQRAKISHYKSKTTFGTGFFNILPILELTLTASMSTGQNRSNESDVES